MPWSGRSDFSDSESEADRCRCGRALCIGLGQQEWTKESSGGVPGRAKANRNRCEERRAFCQHCGFDLSKSLPAVMALCAGVVGRLTGDYNINS